MKTPPLIPWPLLIAAGLAILAAVWASTGHASLFGYQWQQTRQPSLKPWLYVTIADTDRTCREVGADPQRQLGRINACATWKAQGCIVYLPSNAPRWIVEHEERHCEGWDHD